MDKIFVPIANTRRPYKLFVKRNKKRIPNPRVIARLNKNFKEVALPSKYAWDKKNKKIVNLFSGNSNNTSVEFKKLNKKERKQLQYYGTTLYDRKNDKLINKKKVLNKKGGLRKEYINNKVLSSNQITAYKEKIINKIMSFTHTYQIKFKDYTTKKDKVKKTGRTEPRTENFSFNYTNKWTQEQIQAKKLSMIKKKAEQIAEESPVYSLNPYKSNFLDEDVDASVSIMTGVDNYEFDLNLSEPLIIDGMEDQEWSTNNNKCVYDWIKFRYGNIDGCKKITDDKTLFYIFNFKDLKPLSIRADDREDIEEFFNSHFLTEQEFNRQIAKCNDPYKDFCYYDNIHNIIWASGEPAELLSDEEKQKQVFTYDEYIKKFWGVSPKKITNFCKYMKIPHYCLDNEDKVIHYYYPKEKNPTNKIPPMCYKVSGGHIHPITDNTKVRSLAQLLSEYTKGKEQEKKQDDKKKEPLEIVEVINNEDPIKFMIDKMVETKTQVINKKVKMNGENLQSFTLGKTKYIFVETDEEDPINYGKEYCKLNDIEYYGQSLPQIASGLLKETLTIKSEPNHIVNDILHTDKIKYRTHLGFMNGYNDLFMYDNNVKAYDIAKCYSKCITDPSERFMTLDYNAIPQKYNDGDIVDGLYYIETEDQTLYHGTNIYSNAIVKYGLLNNIITKNNILWYIPASRTHSKELFKPLFDKFKQDSKGNENLNKLLNNLTTGLVGISKNKKTQFSCSTNLNDAFNYIQEYKEHNCFLRQYNGVSVYGNKVVRRCEQHNIPIYIQILDESNIRLYELMKDATNNKIQNVIYRKTDCVVVKNANPDIKLGTEWGQYREEQIPEHYLNVDLEARIPQIQTPKFSGDFIYQYVDINDSSDYKQIHQVLRCNGGLMINGSAGTGKSYVIKKISEDVGDDKVARLCFTNKGALNINGQTIHKFLGLNKEGKILQSNIEKIKQNIKLIIIDEVSMVSAYLWARLFTLYKDTGIPFLLVGDWKQIPPVEDLAPFDYLYHPAVVELSQGKIIELTEVYRYDMDLKNASNNVMKLNTKDFGSKVCKKNICYYNFTRKRVNAMVVDMMIKVKNIKHTITIEQTKLNKGATETKEDYEARKKKNPTQTIRIFEGMPLIASSTIDQGEVCVNNEEFTLTKLTNDKLVATSDRPDGEHKIEIELKDFYKHFLVAYCITTHKSQGSTIQGNMTIWDWDRMDEPLRYTALTRATAKQNINFAV
jgi:hypothetical protein